jgi:hypothetical protein
MMPGQCYFDRNGDICVVDGVVWQPKTGVRRIYGQGRAFSPSGTSRAGTELQAAGAAGGATFVGGSGRNVIADGILSGLSTGEKPTGFFRPAGPSKWAVGGFILEVTGSSAATISDGTDIIAELTTGGTAPVGDYESTTYGEDNYNGEAAFTLTVEAEEGTSVGIPQATVEISAGTAQGGLYVPTSDVLFESDTDPDWTIEIQADGTAEMAYLGDVMAIRTAVSPTTPLGIYDATALGKATHNLTDDEPVDGEAWSAIVSVIGKTPRVGSVYIEVIEDTGVLDQVNGPFFATSLPAPDAGAETYYIRLAYSDGYAIEQEALGAIIWP